MKVGDLVNYVRTEKAQEHLGVGLVISISRTSYHPYEVLWADGTTSVHSNRWLVRVKEIK